MNVDVFYSVKFILRKYSWNQNQNFHKLIGYTITFTKKKYVRFLKVRRSVLMCRNNLSSRFPVKYLGIRLRTNYHHHLNYSIIFTINYNGKNCEKECSMFIIYSICYIFDLGYFSPFFRLTFTATRDSQAPLY